MLGLLSFLLGLVVIGLMIVCGYLAQIATELRNLRAISRLTGLVYEELHGLRRQLTSSSDGPDGGWIYRLERSVHRAQTAAERLGELLEMMPALNSSVHEIESTLKRAGKTPGERTLDGT